MGQPSQAQPGGRWHVSRFEMHPSPHAWRRRQTRQQSRAGSVVVPAGAAEAGAGANGSVVAATPGADVVGAEVAGAEVVGALVQGDGSGAGGGTSASGSGSSGADVAGAPDENDVPPLEAPSGPPSSGPNAHAQVIEPIEKTRSTSRIADLRAEEYPDLRRAEARRYGAIETSDRVSVRRETKETRHAYRITS